MQNQKKLEDVIYTYLTPIMSDLLGSDINKLLYCSKNVTETVIDFLIKNKNIG
jgi:hypothetical protein